MPYCTDRSIVKQYFAGLFICPLYCGCWSCPICAPKRRMRLIGEAGWGQPDTFITLTSKVGSSPTQDEAAQKLTWAWRIVRKRACKRYGYDCIPFFAVFEATKQGEPHLHILARCKYIEQKWLSDQMHSLTGAKVVWIERVSEPKRAASYVMKYVGKDPHRFNGCKRYWRSLDYPLEHEDDYPPVFDLCERTEFVRQACDLLVQSYLDVGWRSSRGHVGTWMWPPEVACRHDVPP